MVSVDAVISRFRRDLHLSRLLRAVFAAIAAMCIVSGAFGWQFDGAVVLALIGVAWLFLSVRSARGSRLTADCSHLIAVGQFEQAERQITAALRSFSLFRTVKLVSLHHLAVLRHAQKRWQDSAQLCRAFLSQNLGSLQGLSKPSRLMLADSLLQLNDPLGAHEAIRGLYHQRLCLAEALQLQQLQLEYLGRVGAWEAMLAGVAAKIQLAELIAPLRSAKVQGWLALAAQKCGRGDLSLWLRRRCELLCDPQELKREQPAMGQLWDQPA